MSNWYLIHTKIRQERVALANLERQGFTCFLPLVRVEKLRRNAVQTVEEPLFARYLFIQLGTGVESRSWAPIRSTLGVSRLVSFGQTPAVLDGQLVEAIRERTTSAAIPWRHFEPGEPVVLTQGPFAGVEAIFHTTDAEGRVMVLLSMLSQQVKMSLPPAGIRKRS